MKPFVFWVGAAAIGVNLAAHADDDRAIALDKPVDVDGFEIVCTGIGDEARDDPRWTEYSVRVEFANRDAQYLSDIDVTMRDAEGNPLFDVLCQSPWLLAKLAPGKYFVEGRFEGITKTVKFAAPERGQHRVVITFAEIAGDR